MSKKEKTKKGKWTRRAFMVTGGILGGGLLVGVGGLIHVNKKIKEYTGDGFGDGDSLNAWIRIAPDNTITIAVPRAEMGQGVYTSLPMLIAEELEVEMSAIKIVHPQPESPYANTILVTNKPRDIYSGMTLMEKVASFLPVVGTGGSTTIPDAYDNLRMAGATAREMLKSAAAKKWGISTSDCTAEKAFIINNKNKEKLSYGSLAAAAASIELAERPTLKEIKDFKILGQPIQRLDIPEKVTGQAEFGLDVRLDNMLYAVIKHPSYLGGKITSIKNRAEVEGMDGVKKVIEIPQGVAVVANNTWRARNAALSLEVEEDDGGNGALSSASISKMMDDVLAAAPIGTPEKEGDVNAVFKDATNTIEAKYTVPYLAHAAMEPLNCTMLINDDSAEAWTGHQVTSAVRDAVNEVAGIDKSKVQVNIKYLGGGFGRRSEKDILVKTAHVAQAMKGTPVQLVFTREEDMTNDMYRPAVASQFKASVSADGIEAWQNKIAMQSVANSALKRIMPIMAPNPKDDVSTTEGAIHLPYAMKNREISIGQVDLPAIEVGFWRSVGNSQNGFFTECFMDECAHAAKQDPYQFRRASLKDKPRFRNVLDKVAEMSNWTTPLGEGKYRGIALHKSFGSIVGQVAEISKQGDKSFSIDKMFCVIDCGRIVNPDTIEAQMQSGIVFGLSAALFGQITIDKGQIKEQNFPQYEMLRMNTMPHIEVHIMDVDAYPGGVGEPGTPPAAPAIANALFAATGERLRSLPFSNHGYSFV